MKEKIYDLIIIGAGPAGITAGIFAKRENLETLIIAKNFGGQIKRIERKGIFIENYPGFKKISARKFIQKFEDHLKSYQPEIKKETVKKIKKEKGVFLILTKKKKIFKGKAVIIATGADPRPLEVPGEKKFLGKGVDYDLPQKISSLKGKRIVIVGGGNSGFGNALILSKIAKEIYLLEVEKEFKASQILQEKVKKIQKIKLLPSTILEKIQGQNYVKAVLCQNKEEKKKFIIPTEKVIIAIGSQPATAFAKELVDFNEKDEIKVNFETYQTKTPGLFAVGDVNVGPYKQIITACGEGAKAALAVANYLRKNS